jgi:hypothetical protein
MFAGQIGLNEISVIMSTEKSSQSVAADGTVLNSVIAGDNGEVVLTMQQTSSLHTYLMIWYNVIHALLLAGQIQNWASAALTIRKGTSTVHICTGVEPTKVPDKPYAAQGQNVVWRLMVSDLQTIDV